MIRNIIFSLFFLILFAPICAFATDKNDTTDDLINNLNPVETDSAKTEALILLVEKYKSIDLKKSIDYSWLALKYAEKTNNIKHLGTIYNEFGVCYYYLGDYYSALDNYKISLSYSMEIGDSLAVAIIYNNVAAIYGDMKQYDEALTYIKNALNIFIKKHDNLRIALSYSNIGVLYRLLGKYDLALDYFNKCVYIYQNTLKNKTAEAQDLSNIGLVYILQGKYQDALSIFKEGIAVAKEADNQIILGELNYNIGYVYLEQKQYSDAIPYFLNSLEYATKSLVMQQLRDGYKSLAEAYENTGEIQKAYDCQKLYIAYNDSIIENEETGHINDLKIRHELVKKEEENKILTKENEILEQKKIIEVQKRIAWIGGLVLLLLIGVLMYRNQRGRLSKSKIEKQLLQDKLDYSNKDLTNYALYIIQLNDLFDVLKNDLKKLKKCKSETESTSIINELVTKLNLELRIEKNRKAFNEKLQQVGDNFLMRLEQKFPGLSENEKQLASLLRLNFASKEIAAIFNISQKSVNMNRYRLRKKLNIDTDTDLVSFFNKV